MNVQKLLRENDIRAYYNSLSKETYYDEQEKEEDERKSKLALREMLNAKNSYLKKKNDIAKARQSEFDKGIVHLDISNPDKGGFFHLVLDVANSVSNWFDQGSTHAARLILSPAIVAGKALDSSAVGKWFNNTAVGKWFDNTDFNKRLSYNIGYSNTGTDEQVKELKKLDLINKLLEYNKNLLKNAELSKDSMEPTSLDPTLSKLVDKLKKTNPLLYQLVKTDSDYEKLIDAIYNKYKTPLDLQNGELTGEGRGFNDWLSDAYNSFQESRNISEAGAFGGLEARASEFLNYALLYKDKLTTDRDLQSEKDALEMMRMNKGYTDRDLYNQMQKIKNLEYKSYQLRNAENNLLSYTPSKVSLFLGTFDEALGDQFGSNTTLNFSGVVGNSLLDVTHKITGGWHSGWTDDVVNASRKQLESLSNMAKFGSYNNKPGSLLKGYTVDKANDDLYASRILMIDLLVKNLDLRKKFWQAGYKENMKDVLTYGNKISQYARQLYEKSQDESMWSLNRFKYGTPSVLGSSASDIEKIGTSMATNLALMFMPSGKVSNAARLAVAGVSFASGQAAGAVENNAEVEQAYEENLKKELDRPVDGNTVDYKNVGEIFYPQALEQVKKNHIKLNDKDDVHTLLIQHALAGDIDVTKMKGLDIKRAFLNAAMGANNQYNADMLATTADNYVDLFTAGFKLSDIADLGKIVRSSSRPARIAAYKLRNLSRGISKNISNGVEEAFNAGSVAGLPTGFVTAATRVGYNALPESVKTVALAVKKGLSISNFAEYLPSRFVEKIAPLAREAGKVGGVLLEQDLSERIEEGKQQLNLERAEKGLYNGEQHSLFHNMIDDFLSGTRSAGIAAGLYFNLELTSDKELLRNMKAVAPGGGGYQTYIQAGMGLAEGIKGIKASDIMYNNVLLDKMLHLDNRILNSKFAAMMYSSATADRLETALDDIEKYNRDGSKISTDQIVKARENLRYIRTLVESSKMEGDKDTHENEGAVHKILRTKLNGAEANSEVALAWIGAMSAAHLQYAKASSNFNSIQKNIDEEINTQLDLISKDNPDAKAFDYSTLLDEGEKNEKETATDTRNKVVATIIKLNALQLLKKEIESNPSSENNKALLYLLKLIDLELDGIYTMFNGEARAKAYISPLSLLNGNDSTINKEELTRLSRDSILAKSDVLTQSVMTDALSGNMEADVYLTEKGKAQRKIEDLTNILNYLEKAATNKDEKNRPTKEQLDQVKSLLEEAKALLSTAEDNTEEVTPKNNKLIPEYARLGTARLLDRMYRGASLKMKEGVFKKIKLLFGFSSPSRLMKKFKDVDTEDRLLEEEIELDYQLNWQTLRDIEDANLDRVEDRAKWRMLAKYAQEYPGSGSIVDEQPSAPSGEDSAVEAPLNEFEGTSSKPVSTKEGKEPEPVKEKPTPVEKEEPKDTSLSVTNGKFSSKKQDGRKIFIGERNKLQDILSAFLIAILHNLISDTIAIIQQKDGKKKISADDYKEAIEELKKKGITTLEQLLNYDYAKEEKPKETKAEVEEKSIENQINDIALSISEKVETLKLELKEAKVLSIDDAIDDAINNLINLATGKTGKIYEFGAFLGDLLVTLVKLFSLYIQKGIYGLEDMIHLTTEKLGEENTKIVYGSFISAYSNLYDTLTDEVKLKMTPPSIYMNMSLSDVLNIAIKKPASILVDDSAAQNTRTIIENQIAYTRSHVKTEYTSSSHYFILEDNGKLTMWNRTHDVLPDLYENSNGKLISNTIKKLSLYSGELIIKYINKNVNDNLLGYKLYIEQEGWENLSESQRGEIIRGIANTISDKIYGSSIYIGNIYDAICRVLFSTDDFDLNLVYDKIKIPFGGRQLYLKEVTTFELFLKIAELILASKEKYKNLGWVLYTDHLVWKSTINGVHIAGETDMIAVDREGKIHIIDFKTSNKSFTKSEVITEADGTESTINYFTIEHRDIGFKESKWSTKELYTRLLSIYKQLIYLSTGILPDSILIYPIHVTYDGNVRNSRLEKIFRIDDTEIEQEIDLTPSDNTNNLVKEYNDVKEKLNEVYSKLNYLSSLFMRLNALKQDPKLTNEMRSLIQHEQDDLIKNTAMYVLQALDNNLTLIDAALKNIQLSITNINELITKIEDSIKNDEVSKLEPLPVAPVINSNRARDYNNIKWDLSHLNFTETEKEKVKQLMTVSGEYDFLSSAEFELDARPFNGSSYNYDVFVKVTYKGFTYPWVKIWTSSNKLTERALVESILLAKQNLKEGLKVIAVNPQRTIGLSNTMLHLGELHNIFDTDLVLRMYDNDLYAVEYTDGLSEKRYIGIVKTDDTGKHICLPGKNGGLGNAIFNYPPNCRLGNGQVVIMIQTKESKSGVPVPFENPKLGKNNAAFIADILTGKYGAFNDYFTDPTTGVVTHIKNEDLLRILFPIYSNNSAFLKRNYLYYSSSDNTVILTTFEDDKAHNLSFDLSNPKSRNDFIAKLAEQKQWADSQILSKRLNSKEIFNPFRELKADVDSRTDSKNKVIKIDSSSILFDRDDFLNPNDDEDTEGLSGIAWFMKNNMLQSSFYNFEQPLISFTTATISGTILNDKEELKKESISPDITADDIATTTENDLPLNFGIDTPTDGSEYNSDDAANLNKTQNDLGELDEKLAIAYIHETLGIDIPYEIVDYIIEDLGNSGYVVGRFYGDLIRLSRYAKPGTEFHEVFHRVFEVLLTDEKREKILKEYRLNHNDYVSSDKEVGEILADEFMEFTKTQRSKEKATTLWGKFKLILSNIINTIKALHKNEISEYNLFLDINSGKFKSIKDRLRVQQSELNFQRRYGHMNKEENASYIRNGKKLKHVLNGKMYDKLLDSLAFIVLSKLHINPDGSNLVSLSLNKETITSSYYYESMALTKYTEEAIQKTIENSTNSIPGLNALAMRELLENENWYSFVQKDLANRISRFSSNFKDREEERDDVDSGNASSGNIEGYTHDPYEFSRLDGTTLTVKFFFSLLPVSKYVVENGKTILKPTRNLYGMYAFYDYKYAFNIVLNLCYNVKSPDELMLKIATLALTSEMFGVIQLNLAKYYKSENDDDIATFTQIYNTIKSVKNNFETVVATHKKFSTGWKFEIKNIDNDYKSSEFRRQWGSLFVNGAGIITKDKNNKYVIKSSKRKNILGRLELILSNQYGVKYLADSNLTSTNTINGTVCFGLSDALLKDKPIGIKVKVFDKEKNKYVYQDTIMDWSNILHLNILKSNFIYILNSLGILFTIDELNYTLMSLYNDSGEKGFKLFLLHSEVINGHQVSILDNLLNTIKSLHDSADVTVLNQKNITSNIFLNLPFASYLASMKYKYNRDHTELCGLVVGNKKVYSMSAGSTIHDITSDLNDVQIDKDGNYQTPESLRPLFHSSFSLSLNPKDNSKAIGSILLKRAGILKLLVHILSGFKTNVLGDTGISYTDTGPIEDYMSKLEILRNGGLLFPTLSDKTTYYYLTGMQMPGIDYANSRCGYKIELNPDNSIKISLDKDTVTLLIEYARTERDAIEYAIHTKLRENLKIDNADINSEHDKITIKDKNGKTKKVDLENAKRFLSFTGIYDENDLFLSFANIKEDPETLLKKADKLFFNKTEKELTDMINRMIRHRVLYEASEMQKLGLIKKVSGLYQNVLLPIDLFFDSSVLSKVILNTLLVKNGKNFSNTQLDAKILLYLTDMVVKQIVSKSETERVFTGNPAFYGKILYDPETGNLIGVELDQSKRFGALVSTGEQGMINDGKFPTTYKCAEVVNQMVSSNLISQIRDLVKESTYRTAYIKKHPFTDTLEVDNMPLSSIMDSFNEEELKSILKDVDKIANAYAGGIDVADGAAYISDEMCERLLRALGKWSKHIAEAFKVLRNPDDTNNILSNAEAYERIVTSVIGNYKYSAFGFRSLEVRYHRQGKDNMGNVIVQDDTSITRAVPYYNKMALFPIFDCIATGEMSKILKKMHEQKIDMLMIKSSVKVGSQSASGTEKGLVIDDNFKFNTYDLQYKFLRKLLNTDPNDEDLLKLGTQTVKVALSNLDKNRLYSFTNSDGSKTLISGEQLLSLLMTAVNNLSNLGKNLLLEKFFDKNGNFNEEYFSTFLRELMTRGTTESLADATSLVDKKMKIPLAATSQEGFILSILASALNKAIVRITSPGSAFYQRSVWSMEGPISINGRILNNGKPLLMINEEGSMDCVLSVDYFVDYDSQGRMYFKPSGKQCLLLKVLLDKNGNVEYETKTVDDPTSTIGVKSIREVKKRNYTFNELKEWLILNKIIGGESNILSYRIPTLAQSSIHPLRCVDVLPATRDTVILPAEFTKITGSDFDIDKLFLSILNYKSSYDNESHQRKVTLDIDKDTPKYYLNIILRSYMTLLLDINRSGDKLFRSIDNDTKLILTELKKIREANTNNNISLMEPYQFALLSSQVKLHDSFCTGKSGIGPFALNNNSHIFTMLYDVLFKKQGFLNVLGKTSLSKRYDLYGEDIMSWLSAFINAHVDVAKDPYITELNINKATYNLCNLMIRTGFGKDTLYFLSLPIIKEWALMKQQLRSKFNADPDVNAYELTKEATHNLYKSHFTEQQIKFIEDALAGVNFEDAAEYAKLIFEIGEDGESLLLKYLLNPKYVAKVNYKGKEIDLTRLRFDMLLIVSLNYLLTSALSLSDLVKFSKIDTEKEGKTIIEQLAYEDGMNKIFLNKRATPFEFEGVNKMYRESFIGPKSENVIKLYRKILENLTIAGSPTMMNSILELINSVSYNKNRTELYNMPIETLQKYVNAISAGIKSKFFDLYIKDNNINVRAMFVGTDNAGKYSMRQRLNNLKILIETNAKYAYLKDNILILNLIEGRSFDFTKTEKEELLNIIKGETYPSTTFIVPFNGMEDDSRNLDYLTEAWDALLQDKDKAISNFARDLIVYSFITSGDRNGFTKFFKYVPNSWRISSGYSLFISNVLKSNVELDVDDVILNNWYDNDFVKTYYLSSKEGDNFLYNHSLAKKKGYPLLIGAVKARYVGNKMKYEPTISVKGAPKFIKTPRTNEQINALTYYTVYKLVGTGSHYDETSNTYILYPIYAKVNPKGLKIGNNIITEYGRSDVDSNVEVEQSTEDIISAFEAANVATDESFKNEFRKGYKYGTKEEDNLFDDWGNSQNPEVNTDLDIEDEEEEENTGQKQWDETQFKNRFTEDLNKEQILKNDILNESLEKSENKKCGNVS